MSKSVTSVRTMFWRVSRQYFIAGLFVVMLVIPTLGQSSTTTSATAGTTPSALTPGAPAGAFALSGFDNVNLFNGNLNFALPLLHIGGRGDAQYTMMLTRETHWRVEHTVRPTGCGQFGCTGQEHTYHAHYSWWSPFDPGYGPGVLFGRASGDSPTNVPGCSPRNTRTLTRLTFTTADRTEFELHDAATGGAPQTNFTNCTAFSRGTVFVTADGTSATFVSDTAIQDNYVVGSPGIIYPSGWLMMSNGTRYRIDSGGVTSIRDRNGNMLNFASTGSQMTVTDSLNRVVTVNYNRADTNGVYDEIVYNGFNGAQRTIQVRFNNLSGTFPDGTTVLRPGETRESPALLFPPILNSSQTPLDPWLATGVVLPDGRQYRFRYNKFIELWRVDLPTGGAYEYDYGAGAGTYSTGVVGSSSPTSGGELGIYRRVKERRVYADGVNLEGKMVYSDTFDDPSKVTVDHQDASGNSLGKDEHFFSGNAIPSLSMLPTAYNPWHHGKENKTRLYDKLNGPMLRQVNNTWSQTSPSWWTDTPESAPPNNAVLTDVETTLKDITPNLVSKQHYGYDQFFNRNLVEEYDFGEDAPGSKLRVTETQYVTDTSYTNPNALVGSKPYLRGLPLVVTIKNGSGVKQAETTFEYDNYVDDPPTEPPTDHHSPLVPRSGITGLQTAYQDATTSPVIQRGNVTKVSQWLNTPGGTIDSYGQYDVAGNVVKSIDARDHATLFDFNDRFGTPNNDDEAQSNTPPPGFSSGQMTYAFATKITNALGHIAYAQFDYWTGNSVNSQDANGVVSSGAYDDALDRATKLVVAINHTDLKRQTTIDYDDSARVITMTSDQTTYDDNAFKSATVYDGLGRTIEAREYETASTYIKIEQKYDAMGRDFQTSNPYRSSEAIYWTMMEYDGLSRGIKVTSPGNSLVTSTYVGPYTTVTDQALKQRRSMIDGLGRLIRVDEPTAAGLGTIDSPHQPTSYTYDTLDNLVKVQQGSQNRYNMYDSLKRLLRAFNPEQNANSSLALSDPLTGNSQWNTRYIYDNNSNLSQKTDARSTTTDFTYDNLNRVTLKNYSGTTPDVNYFYDNLPNAKGSLIKVSSTVSVTDYNEFDPLGRVKKSTQTTDGNAYEMLYGYNRAGEMISQSYPSGRMVMTGYDTAGRINGLTGQKTGEPNKTYASSFTYASHGAVTAMTLGNGLIEAMEFNSRLQPTIIKLGTVASPASQLQLTYTYNPTGQPTLNNGNVVTQRIQSPGLDVTQSYTYDQLNRLTQAEENGGANWRQIYDIDQFGNRAVRNTSQMPNPNLTPQSTSPTDFSAFNQATNRLAASTYIYDDAGNLTKDPDTLANAMAYDAENRMTSYTKNSATSYSYDGEGKRVKKVEPGNLTTLFIYNALGQLVAEYTSGNPQNNGTSYLTQDSLGSTRVVSGKDASGNAVVKKRYDYLPFGEEQPYARNGVPGFGGVDSTRQKFTGKEHDNESGLYYFLARYYSAAQGRFTGVDPGTFMPADPQNWNRFVYVQNNPFKYTDPFGKDLYIQGEEADYLVKELSRLTGYKLTRDNKTGRVTIDQKVKRNEKGTSRKLSSLLNEIIGDSSAIVKITASFEKPGQLGIQFDSFRRRTLDVQDYKDIKRSAPELAKALLGHVLAEYYSAETAPQLTQETDQQFYRRSHKWGLKVEGKIISEGTGIQEGAPKETPGYSSVGSNTVEFVYSSVQYDVVFKTGVGRGIGKVDSVTKTKK